MKMLKKKDEFHKKKKNYFQKQVMHENNYYQ